MCPEQPSEVVQVSRRCPDRCQEWCRYPAGCLVSVRSGASTPQVPWSVSGVVQKLGYWVYLIQPLSYQFNPLLWSKRRITETGSQFSILLSADLYYSLLTHLRAVSTAPLFIVYCKPAILHGNCALLLYNHWAERWELGNLVKVFLWLDQQ